MNKTNLRMRKIMALTGMIVCINMNSGAQGCSDAGFCTLRSIKNNTATTDMEERKNEIAVNFVLGKGERSVSYYNWELEYTHHIGKRTSATGKLGYSFINGELAKTRGPSDLFISINHVFDIKSKWQKSFVAGLKIPFDKADIVRSGIHLPMPYQTSLGTTDLVLGLNFIHNSFGATIAVQQPLKPVNGNQFLPGDYPSLPLAGEYLPSNLFSRKGDVLLRLSYDFAINRQLSIRPSLLSVYHEANDTYVDMDKIRRPVEQSAGLTANANIFLDYRAKKERGWEFSLGAPFIVRPNRPDGLTRSFVASITYKSGF